MAPGRKGAALGRAAAGWRDALMKQGASPLPAALPTFSLIIETENLANADLGGLSLALASLERQQVPPSAASEGLIVDSGDLSVERPAELRRRHSWLTEHRAPAAVSYYQAKMLAAGLATGEIIVFCD